MPLNEDLIRAYKEAKYVVADCMEIRVGECHEKLNQWLSQEGAELAAFITPENPYSQQLSLENNAKRHELFKDELSRAGINFVEGYGVDDAEQWPREKSYLLLVKTKVQADNLAMSYGQNAYLLCKKGQLVELVVCSQ